MADADLRELERKALADGDVEALERFKIEWLRRQSWRQCKGCQAEVPVDAWDAHVAKCPSVTGPHGISDPSAQPNRGMRVVTIPPTTSMTQPRKHPFYDRVVLEPGQEQIEFFADTRGKQIWDTNFPRAEGGGLIEGVSFFFYGFSLIPDGRARPEDVLNVWDTAVLEWFKTPQRRFGSWPGRVVMEDQPQISVQDAESEELREAYTANKIMADPRLLTRLRADRPVRDVTITGKPFHIQPQQDIHFRLLTDPQGRKEPVGLMLVLFGMAVYQITG